MASYYTVKLESLDGVTPREPFVISDGIMTFTGLQETARDLGKEYYEITQHKKTHGQEVPHHRGHTLSHRYDFDLITIVNKVYHAKRLSGQDIKYFETGIPS